MGLREGDLKHLVYDIFEIDSFKSKMGSDEDIVTLSFSVQEKQAAEDLKNFLEKGYEYILDADATSGEQSDGTYKVFVEIERDKKVPEQIIELLDGVGKLSEIDNFRFRYYKNFRSRNASLECLGEEIPVDPDNYGIKVNESNLENYKNFFNKSFVESIDMWDDVIKISKKYADPLYFEFVDFGETERVVTKIDESLDVNGFSEVIYLSKYIGDYNITKFGNKLTLDNQNKTLVLKRIQT